MTDQLGALTTIFTEFYYWVTVVLMFLIHVGFCMYEVGASRYKHHQHTLMKNTMLIPLVTVTWFFIWLVDLLGFSNRTRNSSINNDRKVPGLVLGGGFGGNDLANPTNALMAINLNDHIMGVFWAAFLLFLGQLLLLFQGLLLKE